jgi:hypothetical protein
LSVVSTAAAPPPVPTPAPAAAAPAPHFRLNDLESLARSPTPKKPSTGQAAEHALAPKEGVALEGILLAYLIAYYVSSTIERLFRSFTSMMAYVKKDTTGTGAPRIRDPDEMSNKTSVVSSAEEPSVQEAADKRGVDELEKSDAAATNNTSLAETREMASRYIKESEDMKDSGDGMRAMRRHGGTVVIIYGVKRKDFKKMRIMLAAEEVFVPDMTDLKRYGFYTKKEYHPDDWKTPDGRKNAPATWYMKPIVPANQASFFSRDFQGDLEEAWSTIESIPGAVAFRGGGIEGDTRASSTSTWPAGVWTSVRRWILYTRQQS